MSCSNESRDEPEETTMSNEQIELDVRGMSCGSCVRHVTEALQGLPGVDAVDVELAAGKARVRHDPRRVTAAQLIAAVEDAGYEVSRA
jgi:copper ion binding protein